MAHVSVIVCCYNSEWFLKETLPYLANQIVKNGFVYEVILVDNHSTDQTAQVARDIWQKLRSSATLSVVTEFKLGLSYARKTGALASKSEVLVFCDDDNWLELDYLQTAYDFIMANPTIGALGGRSKEKLDGEEPHWWQKEKLHYAVGKQALMSGDVSHRGYVWGAGLVLRRDLLFRLYDVGFNSLLSDRKGSNLTSGGDSEICKWILLMGYRLWYLDTLKFTHYITNDRLKDAYLIKLKEGHHKSQTILGLYNWYLREGTNHKQEFMFQTIKKSVKLIIKGGIKKDIMWKEKLQLKVGQSFKVQPIIYEINKTYLLIKQRQEHIY